MASAALRLHKGQAEVWRTRSRFKVIVAGRRWGKTRYSLTTMIREASRAQRRLIWYVAPSYPMARDIMWPDLLNVMPRRWIKKINHTTLTITLINNSRITLKGADNPDSLRGVGLDFVILDEFQDMHPDVWRKAIRPTLTTTGGGAVFIGTPKSYNHLYELYTLGQKSELQRAGRWHSWQFKSINSPFVPQQEIDEARQDLDPRSFRQEFEASFEEMGGRIYYAFDQKVHVNEKCVFNPRLPIWVGQDFNRDPMSTVIMQPQEDGEVWIIDEISLKNSNTSEVVDELERRYWRQMATTAIFPDPAGSYSQHARGESDLDIFRERGYKRIYHRRKHPRIADRVNCVNRMFRAADGTIRMYVHPKCVNLIDSLLQSAYKEGGREVDKQLDIEHMGDALGYPIEFKFPMRKIVVGGVSI